MGRFSGLGGVKVNQGGVYFLPGDYVVEMVEKKFFKNRKGLDTFVNAAKIITSTNPERAPGTVCSQVITIRPDIFETCMANIKQSCAAALGIEDADGYNADIQPGEDQDAANDRFWDEVIETMVSPENPTKGIKLRLNCVNIKTQAGKDFTKHVWAPYHGE